MNAAMERQIPLDLPHRVSLSRHDFIEGESNRQATYVIDTWPDWPSPVLVVAGPPGSGKSHLAAIWCAASGGRAVAAPDLDEGSVEAAVAAGAVAVEDLHAAPLDERALFHLINAATETGTSVLLTTRRAPAALSVALPDLKSRLAAARLVEIGAPDDDLIRNVLAKLFADRQLVVAPPVIEFIVRRMERSLRTAQEIVGLLDGRALAESRAVSRPLAAAVLAEVGEKSDSDRSD